MAGLCFEINRGDSGWYLFDSIDAAFGRLGPDPKYHTATAFAAASVKAYHAFDVPPGGVRIGEKRITGRVFEASPGLDVWEGIETARPKARAMIATAIKGALAWSGGAGPSLWADYEMQKGEIAGAEKLRRERLAVCRSLRAAGDLEGLRASQVLLANSRRLVARPTGNQGHRSHRQRLPISLSVSARRALPLKRSRRRWSLKASPAGGSGRIRSLVPSRQR